MAMNSSSLPQIIGKTFALHLQILLALSVCGCDREATRACERYGAGRYAGCFLAPACEDDCDHQSECVEVLSGTGCSRLLEQWMDCIESSEEFCGNDCFEQESAVDDCLGR